MLHHVTLSMLLIAGVIAQSPFTTPTRSPLTIVTPPGSSLLDIEPRLTTGGYVCIPTGAYLSGQSVDEATLTSTPAVYSTISLYSISYGAGNSSSHCDSGRSGIAERSCETPGPTPNIATSVPSSVPNVTATTSDAFQIVPTLATTYTGAANTRTVSGVLTLVLGVMMMSW